MKEIARLTLVFGAIYLVGNVLTEPSDGKFY